ncbi:CinA family nicotinamide mononucleotide deamidase-related protein [Escherichia coli]|nr:CinA family nicotinamide mononucleotide deamidase-related protein [Escherichia coli]
MLKVEMLSTGDEVLHGQIVDTNAAWLADFFFHQGLPLSRRNTVGDNLDDLVTILRERSQHADVLIVNGGLGPTSDDLSALAAATAKGEGMVLHEAWLKEMERYFHERGRVMAPSNRKQAELPASAEFINNPVGTACGFAVQLNRCLMFFTPGVPSEFKVMVEHEILPRLREQFTGGLLALQLSRAGAPLLACEVVPSQEETLAQTAHWITERRANHFAGLALAVSGFENEHLNFALATPDGTFALRVRFSTTRYSLAIRQEVCAMMALNMLRRWLNGQDIASEHGWIEVIESMTLSV